LLGRVTQDYIDTQKAIYENNGGEKGLSDEAFIQRYNESFELAEEEKEKQIITWEVTMVHEAGGDNDHPLNRKVVMRVSGADLQRETGLSTEALAYMWEICGPRYDAKKDELRVVCSRSRNREHNRQWCLKVLYDLIMEGNREFPSESYRFTPEGPVEPS
jgi:nucleolar MIF4G domain-containing protein 1